MSNWRKSSFSSGSSGNCVEVGQVAKVVAVRDTKDRDGAALDMPAEVWARFTASLR
ncbi:MAG TPA: DUF397 domain-containing protein [Trebonia sp.]